MTPTVTYMGGMHSTANAISFSLVEIFCKIQLYRFMSQSVDRNVLVTTNGNNNYSVLIQNNNFTIILL